MIFKNTKNTRILARNTCILLYLIHGPPVFSILARRACADVGAVVGDLVVHEAPAGLPERLGGLRQDENRMRGVKRGFGLLFTPRGRLARHIQAPEHQRQARASTGKLGGIGR